MAKIAFHFTNMYNNLGKYGIIVCIKQFHIYNLFQIDRKVQRYDVIWKASRCDTALQSA